MTASNIIDAKRLDNKLEELYKTFVNYVIKAPFFNVIYFLFIEHPNDIKPKFQKKK